MEFTTTVALARNSQPDLFLRISYAVPPLFVLPMLPMFYATMACINVWAATVAKFDNAVL